LTRSDASSMGMRHSAAILFSTPDWATRWAICSSEPGG
jgi:hypothetical protein